MRNAILILIFLPGILLGQEADLKKFGIDTSFAVPKGIEVGQLAPLFQVKDVNGQEVDLDDLRRKGPVVLLFYRGQWCPVCTRYLSNLNDSIEMITSQGIPVIAVGPETAANAEEMKDKTKSNFAFIADTSLKIHKAYDVLFHVTRGYQAKIKGLLFTDIAQNNNKAEALLPVPATYIIGEDGKIKYRQFNYNYKNRASVKSILEHL